VGGEISVYSTDTFELKRKITFTGSGSNLYGLAPCRTENDCLYVSDYWNNRVHKLNISLEHTTTSTSWAVASRPHGLSVNKANNLLIAAAESQKIQEYTSNGSLVRETVDGNSPFQAVELADGTIAVSRFGPVYGVAVLSANGTVLHQYGSTTTGTGPGQMNEPRGLAVSKRGFVIVAEFGNNRISVLNPTLSEAHSMLLPTHAIAQIKNPHAVYLDESSARLYVGEWSSPYRVLVFDNVFVLKAASEPRTGV
jgi:DNA-binding beta-propeller fold protein YncE